jgi:hypothetical protein
LGRAIGQPSDFDPDVSLLVIALTNVNSDYETSIYALAGIGVLLRKTLSARQSLFMVDEGSILLERNSFAQRLGQLLANGAKWGCHCVIGAQTTSEILNSVAGPKFKGNVGNLMCGHIKEAEIDSFVELGFDRAQLEKYATTQYRTSPSMIRSHWLLKRDSCQADVCHYPGYELAIGASNTDENAARHRYLAAYDDPIEAYVEFCRDYFNALPSGIPMDQLNPKPKESTHEKETLSPEEKAANALYASALAGNRK